MIADKAFVRFAALAPVRSSERTEEELPVAKEPRSGGRASGASTIGLLG
jgi:hypothetical protein